MEVPRSRPTSSHGHGGHGHDRHDHSGHGHAHAHARGHECDSPVPMMASFSASASVGAAQSASIIAPVEAAFEVPLDDNVPEPNGDVYRTHYKRPAVARFVDGARTVLRVPQAKPIIALSSFILSLAGVQLWCAWEYKSQALVGYMLIDGFHGVCVGSDLAAIWVARQPADPSHTYGYGQTNVVAAFSLCVLQALAVVWNFLECLEHIVVPTHHDHPSQLSMWVLWLALFTRVFGMVAVRKSSPVHRTVPETQNTRLKHAIAGAVHATLGNGKLHRAVLLSRAFSNQVIMFSLSWALLFLAGTYAVGEDSALIDSMASILISTFGLIATWPFLMHHARILLLAAPVESTMWAKCLRDASTLPGILEIKNEHIWQNGHAETVGSLHVRIARDADAQAALARVVAVFSHVCTHLTVEVKKDEWAGAPAMAHVTPGFTPVDLTGL